ncbi:hypothetical protein ID866_7890 [Astraeus odoratus]|nr:hypothetical protein ID866_7890 [Astraeus odoratus]
MFQDMEQIACKGKEQRPRNIPGYGKLLATCRQASRDGLKWVWIDTCCIGDNPDVKEEAINSMYRWYRRSAICYVYLHDVVDEIFPKYVDKKNGPRWFFRGWTLQELIAPQMLVFFNKEWQEVGTKESLASTLEQITRIPRKILTKGLPGYGDEYRPTAAQMMSWMADRETTKREDQAYALIGLFDVFLPIVYGEREKAFHRLQLKILEEHQDYSVFAWTSSMLNEPWHGSLLADHPSYFKDCSKLVRLGDIYEELDSGRPFQEAISITQRTARVLLPLTRCLGSSCHFQVKLPYFHNEAGTREAPVTIFLASIGDKYYRVSGKFVPSQETRLTKVTLICGKPLSICTFPEHNSFTFKFSSTDLTLQHPRLQDNRELELNTNEDQDISCIADGKPLKHELTVTIGRSFGQDWVHCVPSHNFRRLSQGEQLYHANRIITLRKGLSQRTEFKLMKHIHIPRTIYAVNLIYGREMWAASVSLELKRCVGCCTATWQSYSDRGSEGVDKETWSCFKKIQEMYINLLHGHQQLTAIVCVMPH